jgi:hypothetical protein
LCCGRCASWHSSGEWTQRISVCWCATKDERPATTTTNRAAPRLSKEAKWSKKARTVFVGAAGMPLHVLNGECAQRRTVLLTGQLRKTWRIVSRRGVKRRGSLLPFAPTHREAPRSGGVSGAVLKGVVKKELVAGDDATFADVLPDEDLGGAFESTHIFPGIARCVVHDSSSSLAQCKRWTRRQTAQRLPRRLPRLQRSQRSRPVSSRPSFIC